MIWSLRAYGPAGVFVSERVEQYYAECWPQEALRAGWGHKQAFAGYELYPYYLYVGMWGTLIKVDRSGVYSEFGSLEECMTRAEAVMRSGSKRLRPSDADRKFVP